MKRAVSLTLTFVAGFLMMADFFVPHSGFRGVVAEVRQWGLIVVAFTYVLGVANVAQVHGRRISRRESDWFNSIVLVGSMAVMAGLGIFQDRKSVV